MDALFLEFREELYRFLRGRLNDPADAEDLLQDIFLKLAQLRESPDQPRAYVYRVARNRLADFYQSRSRDERLVASWHSAAPSHTEAAFASEDPDWQQVEGRLEACLRSFADGLAPAYREAVVAVEFEGLAQKEFARRLGEAYSSVKSRVQTGRRQLAQSFLQCCELAADGEGRTRIRPRDDRQCESDCES